MNPRAAHVAIVIVGIACAAFLVSLIASGCGTPPLPAEPPFTVTVAASLRDH